VSGLSFGVFGAIASIQNPKWDMVIPTTKGKDRFQEKLNRGKRKKKKSK